MYNLNVLKLIRGLSIICFMQMGTWVSGNSDSRLYAKEEKTYFFYIS